MYTDDDLLMLSGIQHIAFCERQYALIYIENQWEENVLTIEGAHLHERVDDPLESDKRNNIISLRGLYIVSYILGLTGKADLVELSRTNETKGTLTLPVSPQRWKIKPVEYKRGKPKAEVFDEVQLCAQAICLEEMYQVKIEEAEIFYGKPRRRKTVVLDENLRKLTDHYALRMHQLFSQGITPAPVYHPKCRSCSLFNICQPGLFPKKRNVKKYFDKHLQFES